MKKLSIRVRLALWYLAIFALGEIVFGAGMWLILRHNLYDLVDDQLEARIEDVRNFLDAHKAADAATLQREIRWVYSIQHTGDEFAIYADDGNLIYAAPFMQTHSELLLRPGELKHPVYASHRIDQHPYRFLSQKISVDGRAFAVEIGTPADDAVDTLHLFQLYLLGFAPLLLLISAGVGYWMSRKALAPVDSLVQTAREVSGTNISSRLQKLDTGDELQRLSDTLNEMLDRIEVAFLRVTQFTADASHELRTPVSLIRTEAELALRRSRGEAEYREALQHILKEAERTSELVEQLLALARADSGREALEFKPLDMNGLLRHVAEGWKQVAAIRGMRFSVMLEDDPASVMADETLLRRLVDILLDNAFKYTAAAGTVSLELRSTEENLRITVRDSGIGIPAEEQKKIFERFYRVDKAHSRALGGAGLGLAIAQWIVSQHRGQINVASTPGQGSAFIVDLPKTTVPASAPQMA